MDIPIGILMVLCLIFILIGAVIMLLLQYYLYIKFSNLPEESDEQRHINAKYSLPAAIQQTARRLNASSAPGSATPTATATAAIAATTTGSMPTDEHTAPLAALNFVMQFLFHELKNSNRVRKWFYRKLSLELDELIAKTTTGKLFDKLTIKELELGEQFPEIQTLQVHNVQLDENEERIENLDLLLQIEYKGNFRTTIDADMVLGKKGSLTLKVRQLSGLARLQFTRRPYTHWSLSFLGDPELSLAIESRFQGRQMQSNITSLISNQIRKAVRRKHTLPNYKLRYKPFFHKAPEEDASDGDIQSNGLLEVKISELSRLMCPGIFTEVYCTLTIASLSFVEVHQKDDRNVTVTLDIEIHKAKNQQIGIVFKQSSEQYVEIEAVLPNTPACKSNLKAGDILLAIEGKRVNSIQHVAKIVKSLQSSVFSLRIERVIPGIIRNDAILEDLELYEDLGDVRLGYGVTKATTDGVADPASKQLLQLTARANSVERGTSSESSVTNTPTNSPKKTKLIAKALKKTISRESGESSKDDDGGKSKSKSSSKSEPKRKGSQVRPVSESVHNVEHYYQHSTVDCPLNCLIHMEDASTFKLKSHHKFLNICVYGKCPTESSLLGFVNIPISQILADCCETSLTQCWKRFELNPPIPQDLKGHELYSQSGFNANLCFGDMLLAFSWDGNPNLTTTDTPSKQSGRSKSRTERSDDSGMGDTISVRSTDSTTTVTSTASLPKAHNFIRTHFQRATQCDFCGKKIWLKDAAQCRDCGMCCHKKCITKCQNSTVCGPVDCSNALPQQNAPEFTVTEAIDYEAEDAEKSLQFATVDDEQLKPTSGLEVHRASLTGLFAQGIKRVNSANNLAIPGIVSSLTGTTSNSPNNSSGIVNTKSLPPSPQHSPSRKPSLVYMQTNPFELITRRLESIPSDVSTLTTEQIAELVAPILGLPKEDDVMSLAKNASSSLYSDSTLEERVEKINLLLTKLRLALDSETAAHSTLTAASKVDIVDASTSKKSGSQSQVLGASEDRVQALSVIMLYLCTGLQHAQGVAFP